jgi:beta-mannosidase
MDWMPAVVPGGVAAALRARDAEVDDARLDHLDWWFRTEFETHPPGLKEQIVLRLSGIATLAEVYLNGELLLRSDTMFIAYELDIGERLKSRNELLICCRALAPQLASRRKPRARWRTKLVAEGNLRFFRTMLLGRAPGFAPGPPLIGPWAPVELVRRRRTVVEHLRLKPCVRGEKGVLRVDGRLRVLEDVKPPDTVWLVLVGPGGEHQVKLELAADADGLALRGELVVPEVELWWPHTHGSPTLYDAHISIGRPDDRPLARARVGFRSLGWADSIDEDGIDLHVNDVPVFARGAVWTPPDLTRPYSEESLIRAVLERARAAGMNMIRVPGTAAYESDSFYELCDEFGLLVWQDFMFANLDYPEQDEEFLVKVEQEARQVLERIGERPSLAVLCGSSEVAQQVAMLGLDPELATGRLFGELLPSLIEQAEVEVPYVPSTPWGGDLPFRPDHGVANYYGVGAYLRPLRDARLAQVRFAAECLAFSNVPDDDALEGLESGASGVAHHPSWKAGIPRDAGAGWDFEDVRDHYLRTVFETDPLRLRSSDQERYLELSRVVTGELMAEVFGEWRRPGSPTRGGLVLWLKDLQPGAGWGLLDHRGSPKQALHHLARALAPVCVWTTDEGLGGIVAHVVNDGPEPLQARVRVALYRGLETCVGETSREISLAPHSGESHNVEQLLGHFVDINWAYHFGPPAQDLIVVSLERGNTDPPALVSQSFRLPIDRPLRRESSEQLGLTARAQRVGDGLARLSLRARRFAYGVRVAVPGYEPDDDGFCIEPGHSREVLLRALGEEGAPRGSVGALNLAGRVPIEDQQ